MGDTGHITLTVGTARLVSGLLARLSEMPSTPQIVAEGAHHHVLLIERELPPPHHSQPWDRRRPAGQIALDTDTATAVAELLELFDEIPSTPPAVAADARHQAEDIRVRLDKAD